MVYKLFFITEILNIQIHTITTYQFSRLLGLKLIPPTVRRNIEGQSGILQLHISGSKASGLDEIIKLSSLEKGYFYLASFYCRSIYRSRTNRFPKQL